MKREVVVELGGAIPNKFQQKPLPKKYWNKKMPKKYWKFLKRNHCQKICDKVLCQRISKETFPAKSLERGISTKKKSKHVCQNRFDNFSTKNSLKRNLYQTNFSKLYRKSIGRNISFDKLPQGKSLQINFQKKPLPKNISGKNLQNKYLTKNLYQNHVQRYLYQKISAEKFSEKFSRK